LLLHPYEFNNKEIFIFVCYDKPVALTEHKLDQSIKSVSGKYLDKRGITRQFVVHLRIMKRTILRRKGT